MTHQLRNEPNLPTHFMTDEQQALADQAYRFFFSEFHHLNAEMDDTDDLPAWVFPKLGEMGYLGLNGLHHQRGIVARLRRDRAQPGCA
jgi:isovaleryl-CoA dehydrogenase